jgi:hypothetical protein
MTAGAEILTYRSFLDGMRKGDIAELGRRLDESFTLTHITGYVQPKAEWLRETAAGQFIYHSIEETSVRADESGASPRVDGHIVTDASIYGSRGRWRLRLVVDLIQHDGGWLVGRAVATTW